MYPYIGFMAQSMARTARAFKELKLDFEELRIRLEALEWLRAMTRIGVQDIRAYTFCPMEQLTELHDRMDRIRQRMIESGEVCPDLHEHYLEAFRRYMQSSVRGINYELLDYAYMLETELWLKTGM